MNGLTVVPVRFAEPIAPNTDIITTSATLTAGAQTTVTSPATTPAQVPAPPIKKQADSVDAGVIIVTGHHHAPDDPFEGVNLKSYQVVQGFDRNLVAPLANGYKHAVPSPIRKGLHNFLSNLGEPVIALNFLLQLHPGRAFKTLGRFGLNSSVGIAGFLDVAKTRTFGLPYHPNGFADTLGYYGVKPGPYFYVPLLGATTLRDFVGYNVDGFGLPTVIGKPFNKLYYTVPANTIRALDYRVNYDKQLREISDSSNPYVTARVTYLQQRRAEIEGLHSHKHRAAGPALSPVTTPPPANTTSPVAMPATPTTAAPQQ